jgi:hypothetical protein
MTALHNFCTCEALVQATGVLGHHPQPHPSCGRFHPDTGPRKRLFFVIGVSVCRALL